MGLRSRRKVSVEPIWNANGDKIVGDNEDKKAHSASNSEDWLLSDGDFLSDENSDVETVKRKRGVVLKDGEGGTCATHDKETINLGTNKKSKGSGGNVTREAIKKDDVAGNIGAHQFPFVDDNSVNSPFVDVVVEGQNVLSPDASPPAKKRKRADKPVLLWHIWEEENKQWVRDTIDEAIDLENHNERVDEIVEVPADLILPLLRYQKEWLAWAMKQEASESKGGILADEMGMGKTIQAIALVLAKREWSLGTSQFSESSLSGEPSTGLLQVKGTLVICPVVAVTQWANEINRFTAQGSTKVLIFHGANREKSIGQVSEYDFVLTTYALVESEYRCYIMPPKRPCIYCGQLYHQSKMTVHLKYFCGPGATRTANQSKQQRKEEISKKHIEVNPPSSKDNKSTLKGSQTDSNAKRTSRIENGASSLQAKSKGTSILHSVKWNRIILDEAHSIKDRKCNTSKAVFALESSFKWALSGTPLQNRVGELYSLIRFLRINPYSYYFCKDCDCKTLDYMYLAAVFFLCRMQVMST